MEIEITKELFEENFPAAKMPDRNTSVFDRMEEMFNIAYDEMIECLVSGSCESAVNEQAVLKRWCIRFVCLDAFIRTCRSQDLVLTSTGFGIVSTQSTAPASRARVDALIEEMSIERIITRDHIIRILMQIPEWGGTKQAKNNVSTLFYSPDQLQRLTSVTLTTENWQRTLGRAVTADTLLRKEISHEYMDDLLTKLRTNTLENEDREVVTECLRFIADFISQPNTPIPNRKMLEPIVEILESCPQKYPCYQESSLYKMRHAERYRNRKEDPTFFFM